MNILKIITKNYNKQIRKISIKKFLNLKVKNSGVTTNSELSHIFYM